MKRKVTFRRCTLPSPGEDDERGDFIESFSEEIEGVNLMDIGEKADEKAKQLSVEWKEDVSVFEIIV